MRTLIKNGVIACALLFVLNGCTKTESSLKTYTVTESDAAAIIANNLLPQYGGLVNGFDQCNSIWGTSGKSCGLNKDTTINGTNATNATVIYKYVVAWHYTNNCQGQLNSAIEGKLSYEGANYAGDATIAGNIQTSAASKVPFISILSNNITLNGMQRVKGQTNAAFNTAITFTDVNLTTDPIGKKIVAGTTNVTIVSTGAGSYNFSGTVKFMGYNKAQITLNSGTVYPISW